uniref:CSON005023 protein n=1 Tax=Culicoides sonorensis TaxID=179676 RepID=A0A336LZK4_CULSO
MNIYVHVIPFYIDIFYRIYCSLFQFNSIILHKRFSFKMKRFSNLMDIAEVSPNQIILKDSKVKKPYESFLSSRVSSKFNRKCIKLKLKEKLLERKMKSDSDSGEKTDRVNDISENTASPLTQLANAFGGICTFQTPTSTRQSESRVFLLNGFILILNIPMSGLLFLVPYQQLALTRYIIVNYYFLTVFRFTYLLEIYLVLETIQLKLREMKNGNIIKNNRATIIEVIHLSRRFSSVSSKVVFFSAFHCFYELMMAIKRWEDSARRPNFDALLLDVTVSYWNILILPFIIVIINRSECCHERVNDTLDVILKSYIDTKDPKMLSLFYFLDFNRYFDLISKITNDIHDRIYHRNIFHQLDLVLTAYSMFTKIYGALISVTILECFYFSMFAIKYTQDLFIEELAYDTYMKDDAILLFWYIFHVPWLFFLLHLGDEYQKEISSIKDSINRKLVKEKKPDLTSYLFRLRFNEGLTMQFTHKTIFKFCYQIMGYHVRILLIFKCLLFCQI